MDYEGKLNLLEDERYWLLHFHFLAHRGYHLRPRFDPNHVPLRSLGNKRKCCHSDDYEDEIWNERASIVDAVRTDGTRCVLRRTRTWSDEIPVLQHIAGCGHDERNHVVPILDIVLLPTDDDEALIVMPLLRLFFDPPFVRVSEVLEAVRQYLECMQFLHENLVAHRDFCALNLMMDSSQLIPGGFHFASTCQPPDASSFGLRYSDRTQVAPMRYFLTDFGLAIKLPARGSLVTGVFGQDRTVPELSWEVPYDPFKVDIYQFGRVIFRELIDAYDHLECLRPLGEAMTRASPDSRPDADGALKIFEGLVQSMSDADLKRRLVINSDRYLTYAPRVRWCYNPYCAC
ncbi:hypothetical protein HDZ31DRAFT_37456 [Schizophyllum fasciatum]